MEISPQIIMFIAILIFCLMLIAFFVRGEKALSIFPDNIEKINFRDKKASGYSTKSMITKMGGANRSLDIVITTDELWIKSNILLASIVQRYDLLHKIPLENIQKAEKIGSKIILNFRLQTGEDKQIVIILKRPEEFLKAIKITTTPNTRS